MPRTYDQLLALADEAEIVLDPNQQKPDQAAAASGSGNTADGTTDGTATAIEADDDPHRLARVNLERYATRGGGRTLAFWRDEWYVWKRNAYRKISGNELRAKISRSIKEEFDRLNLERQQAIDEAGRDDAGPPEVKKVSMALVSNVLQATSGMVCVSGEVEPNTWLPTREKRNYTSMLNGILDIDEFLANGDECLVPNTPQWFSQVSLPYEFDPESKCPRWLAFLSHNLEGDQERIKVCQEWAGYLLCPTTDQQKFMILEGEGSNGKSVFIAAITAMLGVDNVSTVALENFGDRFARTDTIGKLLNAAGDCGELDKTAEGILKSFTSGDRMYFDRKGIPGINCTPTARLMIACNNRPRFSDRSDGIWRRMLVIPWRVAITADRRVRGMDKVGWWQDSGELPGILIWALLGLDRLRRQGGFSRSEVMEESLGEYKDEMNPTRVFLEENLEESDSGMIRTSEVYKIYRKWIEENGHKPLAERSFGKEVFRFFKKCKRVRRGTREERYWAYEGIQFSADEVCGQRVDDLKLF